jgi:galactokinase
MNPRNGRPKLQARFQDVFGGDCRLFRAPGRVNLIGEHTDYNDGFVLPVAIGLSCWVAAAPRTDHKLVAYSENYREICEASLSTPLLRTGKWFDYPLGVAWALQQAGIQLSGADLYIFGDIPAGIGLSSSAAIELATGYALLDLAGEQIDRLRLALLCQRAENTFVGMRCGIMDQFVSCFGQSGCALFLDCRSLDYRFVALPESLRIVVCNTTVTRELGSSEYNVRRAQCEEGAHLLSKRIPGVESLRDVSYKQLMLHRNEMTEVVWKRCKHVVTENDRVCKAVAALQAADLHSLTEAMFESHRSLRDDFDVSCPELDLMVELCSRQAGVHGARMTGGGFGGCTVNIVDVDCVADFVHNVAETYHAATNRKPDIYVCVPSDGAEQTVLANVGSVLG